MSTLYQWPGFIRQVYAAVSSESCCNLLLTVLSTDTSTTNQKTNWKTDNGPRLLHSLHWFLFQLRFTVNEKLKKAFAKTQVSQEARRKVQLMALRQ